VLHVLELLSKWQAVRKASKYYEPCFVDEEIKAKKAVTCCSLHSETASELGLPFPAPSPICSILLASTWLSNWTRCQHTQQLPSSLQVCKQTSKIQFHQLLQSADQIPQLQIVISLNCDRYQCSIIQETVEGSDLLQEMCSSTGVVTVRTITSTGISDIHLRPALTSYGHLPRARTLLYTKSPRPNSLAPKETNGFTVSPSYPLLFLKYV